MRDPQTQVAVRSWSGDETPRRVLLLWICQPPKELLSVTLLRADRHRRLCYLARGHPHYRPVSRMAQCALAGLDKVPVESGPFQGKDRASVSTFDTAGAVSYTEQAVRWLARDASDAGGQSCSQEVFPTLVALAALSVAKSRRYEWRDMPKLPERVKTAAMLAECMASWARGAGLADQLTGPSTRHSFHSVAVLSRNRIATASWRDPCGAIWDCKTGKSLANLRGHTSDVNALAALPNDRLATGSRDGSVRIWDVNRAKSLHRMKPGDDPIVFIHAIAGMGHSCMVATAGANSGVVNLYDVETGRKVTTLDTGHAIGVCVIPDGDRFRLVSTSQFDNRVSVWDIASGKAVTKFSVRTGVADVHTFSECEQLAVAYYHPDDGPARGSDIDMYSLSMPGRTVGRLRGHTNKVHSLTAPPATPYLVSGSADGTVRMWNISKPGDPALFALPHPSESIRKVACLMPGREPLARIASLTFSGIVTSYTFTLAPVRRHAQSYFASTLTRKRSQPSSSG